MVPPAAVIACSAAAATAGDALPLAFWDSSMHSRDVNLCIRQHDQLLLFAGLAFWDSSMHSRDVNMWGRQHDQLLLFIGPTFLGS